MKSRICIYTFLLELRKNFVSSKFELLHTAAIKVDGFVNESPAVIFLDNISSYDHDMLCTQLQCILAYPSQPVFSPSNQYQICPLLCIFISYLLQIHHHSYYFLGIITPKQYIISTSSEPDLSPHQFSRSREYEPIVESKPKNDKVICGTTLYMIELLLGFHFIHKNIYKELIRDSFNF